MEVAKLRHEHSRMCPENLQLFAGSIFIVSVKMHLALDVKAAWGLSISWTKSPGLFLLTQSLLLIDRKYFTTDCLEENISKHFHWESAITLTKDNAHHTRTKHIDIRYHFIHYVVQNGKIKLIYCLMNKTPLPSLKAKHFAAALGLCAA